MRDCISVFECIVGLRLFGEYQFSQILRWPIRAPRNFLWLQSRTQAPRQPNLRHHIFMLISSVRLCREGSYPPTLFFHGASEPNPTTSYSMPLTWPIRQLVSYLTIARLPMSC